MLSLQSNSRLKYLHLQEGEYDDSESPSSTPQPVPTPGSDDNLDYHPFFQSEFAIPPDSYMDELIAVRRIRETASPPSSPLHFAPEPKRGRGRKRKASKADLAGLISGDSDSSALTQESGDDNGEGAAAQTPSDRRGGSVVTATDAGTEDIQDEEGTASPGAHKFFTIELSYRQCHDRSFHQTETWRKKISAARSRGHIWSRCKKTEKTVDKQSLLLVQYSIIITYIRKSNLNLHWPEKYSRL